MLSIVISYFRQPAALDWQIAGLEALKDYEFELIVVDDGSGDNYSLDRLRSSNLSGKLVNIKDDVAWNLPGARNWGMVFASHENCLRTDIDHRPTPEMMGDLVSRSPLEGLAFRFARVNELGETVKSHSDSYFLSRSDYWGVGGYDERFSGAYGQNARDFYMRASQKLRVVDSPLALETNRHLKSDGNSRSLLRNRIVFNFLSRENPRRISRLKQSVTVHAF